MARRRKRGKRRKMRYNPKSVVKGLTAGVKDVFSAATLKDAGAVAAGSITAPIVGAVATGLVNRFSPVKLAAGGLTGKAMDIFGGALASAVFGWATKKSRFAGMMMLGTLAGVMNDLAVEYVLPMVGMGDYLQLPGGMGAYLSTKDLGMGDYVSARQLGLRDWATTGQVSRATASYSPGESF